MEIGDVSRLADIGIDSKVAEAHSISSWNSVAYQAQLDRENELRAQYNLVNKNGTGKQRTSKSFRNKCFTYYVITLNRYDSAY